MKNFKYTRKKLVNGAGWLILTLLLVAAFAKIDAQNVIQIQSATAEAQQQCTVSVTISNTQPFVGFQLDIPLPNQLTFIQNSGQLNPSRSNGHSLTASIINGNILRIISFSFSNQPFNGTSGEVVSFQLTTGTVPGTYILPVTNGVIANSSSVNILTSVIDGSVTVLAPDIYTNSSTLSFGSIPLGSHQDMQLSLQNLGNQSLYISQISFNSPYFQVVGNSTFVISAGQSTNITVRFTSQVKGAYNKTMQIYSNDPDEPVINIGLLATAFAVNELHCGTIQAASGTMATLGLSINNMEPFSAFQFDLVLPQPLNYIHNSAYLNPGRSNGHSVSAELINSNTLRVVGFSVTNQAFNGFNGDVVHLQFGINGTGGNYNLGLSNVIIADASGQNIMSAYYNNVLVITAPDISLAASLSFGEVSIISSSSASLDINNFGAESLILSSFDFSSPNFSTPTLFPVTIQPWSNATFQLDFSPSNVGVAEGLMHIYSNDPDENPFQVNLSANVYAPNYMSIPPIGATQQDTVFIDLTIQNYDPFIAFECELHFNPGIMDFLESAGFSYLTERSTDHLMYVNEISPGIVKLISFSFQQNAFTGNQGSVARIGFAVSAPSIGVTYPVSLANSILANPQGQNVLYASQNGSLTIVTELMCPEAISICINDDGILLSNGQPTGGIFSGNGVINNHFYPNLAGLGTHTISYAYTWEQGFTHECSFLVTVFALPEVVLEAFPDICENDGAFQLYGGVPSGGFYSGDGVISETMFDPSIAGSGITQIIYTYTDPNGCSNSAFSTIQVNPAPDVNLVIPGHVCINSPSFVLNGGTPEGGTYSGNGVVEGYFYPEVAGTGSYSIVYTYTDINGCSASATEAIMVNPLIEAALTIEASLNPVCAGSEVSFSLSEIQNGGESPQFEWFVNGLSTGILLPSYTYLPQDGDEVYCALTSSASCLTSNPVASSTIIVNVNPLPEVTFNLEQDVVCVFWDSFLLTGGEPEGGIYSGVGTVDNIFNPALAGLGSHDITYTYLDENGCQNHSTAQILVDPCTSIDHISDTEKVQIHPNPAERTFTLTLDKIYDDHLLLDIHSVGGEFIQRVTLDHGQKSFELEIAGVSAGVYILHIQHKTFNIYRKLVIK